MGGVFIIKGMGVRLTGLVVTDDEATASLETRFEVYPALLETAIDHVERAEEANARLLAAVQAEDEETKADALIQELKEVLVAITTSAFALEAFQARIGDVVAIPDELQEAWKRNRTGRARRIVETLTQGFNLPADMRELVNRNLDELFKFRSFAVHPASGFEAAVLHPDLGAGVSPALVRFRFRNGREATRIALRTIHVCLQNPKRADLTETWAKESETLVGPLVERWEARYGSLWDYVEAADEGVK